MEYHLAIDMGASSGRHMLGYMDNGKLHLEEVYRFENGMKKKDGELSWDTDYLFHEILEGMKRCKDINKIPKSVGIDTWAVDFVLLDENDKIMGNTVGYRDKRTNGMDELVYSKISPDELYSRTGIQKQIFNTIFQIEALKQRKSEDLKRAVSLLMIPDYFHYCLTGIKCTEYTNATTTGLVNVKTKDWDAELLSTLDFPAHIFQKIISPGSILGELSETMQKEVGYNCKVIIPATHDTGSAVVSVPTNRSDSLYISSGTWSLMGIEKAEADCSLISKQLNFTNEGGYNNKIRYLKNIMGLWMIQSAAKEFETFYSFSQICEQASKETIKSIVDCNDDRFLAPESMIEEIKKYCVETNQEVPTTDGMVASVIYNSLAFCYKQTIEEIEKITNTKYKQINVIGGGANADYLNKLTAFYTKKNVLAGPGEATAIGNIIVQMIALNKLNSIEEARECIYQSFEIKEYKGE